MSAHSLKVPDRIPTPVLEALDVIVSYCWDDEKRDFEENDEPPTHVFRDLEIVNNWLAGAWLAAENIAASRRARA